ncbi:MAG: RNHCP domain-containing protein [bacterium]|nr:RNHCP domain-containing protein [bacterium]
MKKINENFVCISCGKLVPLASKTCRNHCPYCFVSLHVDGDVPGDRTSSCHGLMKPVSYIRKHGDIKILFRCEKCGKEHWNKRAEDDDIEVLLSQIKHD